MTRRGRIVAVTIGLAAVGAVLGAVAGALAFVAGQLLVEAIRGPSFSMLGFWPVPAVYGGILGAVAAPLAGWLLLRRVPLGLAVVATVLGTVAGGIAGWIAPVGPYDAVTALGGAAVGFVLTAVLLRLRAGRERAPAPDTPA